jgi:hypothetical protein
LKAISNNNNFNYSLTSSSLQENKYFFVFWEEGSQAYTGVYAQKIQADLLPITTIYILGFILPEIETACIKVERNYKDMINKTVITKKNRFIECLTHDSYVVQTGRITDRYQTCVETVYYRLVESYRNALGQPCKEDTGRS